MSNKELIRAFLKALDAGDQAGVFTLIEEWFADSYLMHSAGETLEGRDGLKDHVLAAYAMFAEMEHLVEDDFTDGDNVATRVRFRALVKNDFVGLAAAGRLIDCPIIYLHRFVNGKVAEAWLDWDSLFVAWKQVAALAEGGRA